jgi:nucleoside-diphosphate-sugar epimerase
MLGELTGRADLLSIGARPVPPDEPEALVPLVRRLKEEVGYLPRYSLEDGLRETVAWWRARINEEGA